MIKKLKDESVKIDYSDYILKVKDWLKLLVGKKIIICFPMSVLRENMIHRTLLLCTYELITEKRWARYYQLRNENIIASFEEQQSLLLLLISIL